VSLSRTKALVEFLTSLFTADELRRFAVFLPGGNVAAALPSGTASLETLAFEMVQALDRRGQIDGDFFARLEEERPGRKTEIAQVRAQILDSTASASALPPRIKEDLSIHLTAYAAWAREKFQHLPMIGLGGGELELVLDEVYVPLAFAPQEFERWGAGKEQADREAPENVDLREAFTLAGDRHLFVRGEPGTGKTTALKKLLWSLLSADRPSGFDGRALGLMVDTVPVFLRLRSLAGPPLDRDDFGEVLDEALVAMTQPAGHHVNGSARSTAPPGLGRWLWQRGNVLLLLDGLDEIAAREARRQACRRIETLARQCAGRGIRVVVSSRFAGIERDGNINLDHGQFLHLDVRPLDNTQISDLVTKWYAAAGRARSRMRREREELGEARSRSDARRLLEALQDEATIKLKELASTPLFLTLLCLVVERGGHIPERRVDFFRVCLDTLLGSWAHERASERLLTLDESLDLLELVAWAMHNAERQYDLGTDELRALLAAPIRRLQNQRGRTPVVTFQGALHWLCQVAGVLTEYAEGEYGFMHLGLQEYLAATHAAQTGKIGRLAEVFGNPWWREVTLLAVALREHRVFTPLMERVVASSHLMREFVHIYECLLEAHHRDITPFLALIRDPHAGDYRRIAALRLVHDWGDEDLIALTSELAMDTTVVEELRLVAEHTESKAPPIQDETSAPPAIEILLVCDAADEPRARALAGIMSGWGSPAAVVTAQHAGHVWPQPRSVIVLAGPADRGPWQSLDARRCLLQMVRRKMRLVLALDRRTDPRRLPLFLRTSQQRIVDANLAQVGKLYWLALDMSEPARSADGTLTVNIVQGEREGEQSFVEERTGIRFLWIPGGRFWMGSRADDEDADDDEKPRHLVELSGYWLAETPVTNKQYEMFVREQQGRREPRFWKDRKYNQLEQPVVGVSWEEARAFCRWLSEISGQTMELPTEAQWEFAARGEEGRRYPWGEEEPDETRAHYGKTVGAAPLPVGNLPAGRGPFGHLDLAGNVWEWCLDAWDPAAYQKRGEFITASDELEAPYDDPGLLDRVCRGGAFSTSSRYLRSACRRGGITDSRLLLLGFRVAAVRTSR
jgi:formylglycine-generating enzyme required for sulfatase activity